MLGLPNSCSVLQASLFEFLSTECTEEHRVSQIYFEEISGLVENWENLGSYQLKGIENEIEVIKIL